MKPVVETQTLSLEGLSHKLEETNRKNQSEKDRAIKYLQRQVDDLRIELSELRDMLKEYLVEENSYDRQ